MKKILILLAFFGIVLGLSLVFTKRYLSQQNSNPSESKKIQVTASFYPLYFFAKEIGGEYASVINLTPAGSEPHDYDLSPKQIAQIQNSHLLIIIGEGFEPWAQKIHENIRNKNVTFLSFTDQIIDGDPHIWLNDASAEHQVKKILAEYIAIDPAHRSAYEKNAEQLRKKLSDLNVEMATGLIWCKQRKIVTAHNAFTRFAYGLNLTAVSISGLSADAEPSAAKMAEITQFVRDNDVHVIFFETLVSPKLAQTIARETGARTAVLNPLEGLTDEELQSGQDYFSIQRQNLATLRTALQCQ